MGPSEFQKDGPKRSGVIGLHWAWEKARLMRRTEQNPEGAVDLDASPDVYLSGGVTKEHTHRGKSIR